MICKNCGYDNDDKKFICENCGYALYDESKSIDEQQNLSDIEKTQTFSKAVVGDNKPPVKAEVEDAKDEDEETKKKQIAIIIALAVVLVVIIVSIIIGIASSNKKDNNQPTETTTGQTTILNEIKEEKTTQSKTTTTTTTTEAAKLSLGLSCNAGGSVTGNGAYDLGENVTVIAKPDAGYEFGGWYVGNNKVSTNKKYTFTITENTSLKAVFIYVSIEEDPSDSSNTTETTQINNLNGADD